MKDNPSYTGCPLYNDEAACRKVKKDRNCYQCKLCEYSIKWKELKSWHEDFDKLKAENKRLEASFLKLKSANERLTTSLNELRTALENAKEQNNE